MTKPAYYCGKMRLIVQKITKTSNYDDGYEVFESDYFDDQFITDFDEESCPVGPITYEITEGGYSLFSESIEKIIEPYPLHAIVEIVADVCIEHSVTDNPEYGTEYITEGWLDNAQQRRLTNPQIETLMEDWRYQPEIYCACGPHVTWNFDDNKKTCIKCGYQIQEDPSP